MNIDELTLGQIKQIRALIGEAQQTSTPKHIGQHIVVLDRGFVYVGEVEDQGEYLHITNAKNIRVWGTTKGLGELRDGPLSGTKIDVAGEVKCPKRALIHMIPCKGF